MSRKWRNWYQNSGGVLLHSLGQVTKPSRTRRRGWSTCSVLAAVAVDTSWTLTDVAAADTFPAILTHDATRDWNARTHDIIDAILSRWDSSVVICRVILEKNCPRSRIEVKPTALLLYHTHMSWTVIFDLELWPLLSISSELWSWSTYTQKRKFKGQSIQEIEWKQKDWQKDASEVTTLWRYTNMMIIIIIIIIIIIRLMTQDAMSHSQSEESRERVTSRISSKIIVCTVQFLTDARECCLTGKVWNGVL